MKRKVLNIAIYAVALLGVIVVVGIADGKWQNRPCAGVRPELSNEEGNHFLTEQDVVFLMNDLHGSVVENEPLGKLSVADLEENLLANPYVKSAEVYKDREAHLVTQLELRRPVGRLVIPGKPDFYLDDEGHKMPLSQDFAANTLLIRGDLKESLEPLDSLKNPILNDLLPMLVYIQQDDFLSAQISEVVVDKKGEVMLFPEMGNVTIEFGKPKDWQEKFIKMNLFNQQVLNKVGWDQYESISLKYKGQVVAKKRT